MARKKLKRSLTFKEIVLLTILLILLLGYGTLNYLLTPAMESYKNTKTQFDLRTTQKQLIDAEVLNKGKYLEKIGVLAKFEREYQLKYPARIDQDQVILKIYQFSKKADVHISAYNFSGLVESTVEDSTTASAEPLTEEEKIRQAVTAKADEYTKQVESDIQKRYEEELGISTGTESGEAGVSINTLMDMSNNEALKNQILTLGTSLLTYDVNIKVKGSFSNLNQFMRLLETSQESVYIKQSNFVAVEDGVAASIDLRFLGYKDNETTGEYQTEIPADIKSQGNIFTDEGAFKMPETEVENKTATATFSIIVQSAQSNGAKFYMMQGTNDASIIYQDINNILNSNLTIEENKGDLIYNYQLGDAIYAGELKQFKDNEILLEIISKDRISADDIVGLKLNVENTTDKLLKVKIVNDDLKNPRIVIDKLIGKVQVN